MIQNITAAELAERLGGRGNGNGGYIGRCPAHEDSTPSLSISESNGKTLVHCHAGCPQQNVIDALKTQGNWPTSREKPKQFGPSRLTAKYNYNSPKTGKLLYQSLRYEPGPDGKRKTFKQRRPDGQGSWIWNLDAVTRVLYRQREIQKAKTVWVVEGEKDVATLKEMGFAATCNVGGAGKWKPEYSQALKGKRLRIIPDADVAGYRHALQVARSVLPLVASLKMIELPDAKDVSDWQEAGHTRTDLLALVEAAPIVDAAALDDLELRWLPKKTESVSVTESGEHTAAEFTDMGNATLFATAYADTLRFCPAMDKWLVWDTMRWSVDKELRAESLAQELLLKKLREATATTADSDRIKHLVRSRSDRAIRAMLHLAQPLLVVTPERLDQNPDLLNFKNGTLDLRTGVLRPHSQEDFLTKLVHHNYKPEAKCPVWKASLNHLMGGATDPKRAKRLVSFLQSTFGYSLTAHTSEKAVYFCIGVGDTGKSTVLFTFGECIAEYAMVLQAETLFSRQENANTQADLADLRGVRFVRTSELDEGVKLREGKLKRITQGLGQIKSCRKYENPILFTETHKLWIDANHAPEITTGDDALWNRINVIPFNVVIPRAERKKNYAQELLVEAEGILAWAVRGAVRWYKDRLNPPVEVTRAVRAYRSEEDKLKRFLAECCQADKGNTELTARAMALYQAYRVWCENNGEGVPLSNTAFGRRLTDEGFTKRNDGRGIVYRGIELARTRLETDEED